MCSPSHGLACLAAHQAADLQNARPLREMGEVPAHLLLQLVLIPLPGQLVLVLGPLEGKRTVRTHLRWTSQSP